MEDSFAHKRGARLGGSLSLHSCTDVAGVFGYVPIVALGSTGLLPVRVFRIDGSGIQQVDLV